MIACGKGSHKHGIDEGNHGKQRHDAVHGTPPSFSRLADANNQHRHENHRHEQNQRLRCGKRDPSRDVSEGCPEESGDLFVEEIRKCGGENKSRMKQCGDRGRHKQPKRSGRHISADFSVSSFYHSIPISCKAVIASAVKCSAIQFFISSGSGARTHMGRSSAGWGNSVWNA